MKEKYLSPAAYVILLCATDVIAASAEIPSYENDNSGEWEDL